MIFTVDRVHLSVEIVLTIINVSTSNINVQVCIYTRMSGNGALALQRKPLWF